MKLSAGGLSAAAKTGRALVELAQTDRREVIQALKAVPPTELLKKVTVGAPLGIAAITALPVFGAVGAITATGVAVGATIGALAALTEEVRARRDAAPEAEKNE